MTACAYEAGNAGAVECASSNAHGEYTIARLPTGNYKVEFSAHYYEWEEGIGGEGEGGEPAVEEEFATQFYEGAPSLAAATSVPVTAGEVAGGIDAQMSKPVPPPPGLPPGSPQEGGPSQGAGSGPGAASPPPLRPPAKPKTRCRKGLKKKTVHGKRRCVKVHRHHRGHHRRGR